MQLPAPPPRFADDRQAHGTLRHQFVCEAEGLTVDVHTRIDAALRKVQFDRFAAVDDPELVAFSREASNCKLLQPLAPR